MFISMEFPTGEGGFTLPIPMNGDTNHVMHKIESLTNVNDTDGFTSARLTNMTTGESIDFPGVLDFSSSIHIQTTMVVDDDTMELTDILDVSIFMK